MARPVLTERRKAQTRREIAESAIALFMRDRYETVTAEAIAEEAGVSLRTFYRYFPGKDAVLSPIVTDGISELIDNLRSRPASEGLATAFLNAYEDSAAPRHGEEGVRILIGLFLDVPALRSRWLEDLRLIEQALIPVIHDRARRRLSDSEAQLSAAALVTALRVALEQTVRNQPGASVAERLLESLSYLRQGAKL